MQLEVKILNEGNGQNKNKKYKDVEIESEISIYEKCV